VDGGCCPLEDMGVSQSFWAGRRVFVTGHTGFKGSWLAIWLKSLGARVSGYSLPPPTDPSLFHTANVAASMDAHVEGDVRDLASLKAAMLAAHPEIVIHLAAQSLVRRSYSEPVETFATNVMGTVNVIEAARSCQDLLAVLSVTTDKCYENRDWIWGYREDDSLGGRDPYSSSKACAELVTAAYRSSYFESGTVGIATARAGNVIGGGDWAADRLMPDFLLARRQGVSLEVRHPEATRPWQHVLEPLSGYLLLAERLSTGDKRWAGAWNFGPRDEDNKTVAEILDYATSKAGGERWHTTSQPSVHEARALRLDSSRARHILGWKPRWDVINALDHTIEWHEHWIGGADMRRVCLQQIDSYSSAQPCL